MDMKTLAKCNLLVAATGGEITATDEDGVPFWSIGLTPGIHEGRKFALYMGPEHEISLSDGVTAVAPAGGRASPMKYGKGANDSGANPDYRPTSADQAMREMQQKVMRLTQKQALADRKLAQYARVAAEQDARREAEELAREEAEVIEKENLETPPEKPVEKATEVAAE